MKSSITPRVILAGRVWCVGAMLTMLVMLTFALAGSAQADPNEGPRTPDLGDYEVLEPPAGNQVAFHTYAVGVQIYRWSGSEWVFVGPEAALYSDAEEEGMVGIHYAGPTWESRSGSKVVATVLVRATPDPDAIPWLLLKATSSQGPGIFHRVSYIQRVNTVGGKAPSAPGVLPGEEARVPYAAEYYFYRQLD